MSTFNVFQQRKFSFVLPRVQVWDSHFVLVKIYVKTVRKLISVELNTSVFFSDKFERMLQPNKSALSNENF